MNSEPGRATPASAPRSDQYPAALGEDLHPFPLQKHLGDARLAGDRREAEAAKDRIDLLARNPWYLYRLDHNYLPAAADSLGSGLR